ncbi:hypothetical protein [Lelliottia amnigena]|uniref:hypothetical protein n=1 Tax=Lelliottia amnigena TaxID=61646 RepID=UPI003F56CF74
MHPAALPEDLMRMAARQPEIKLLHAVITVRNLTGLFCHAFIQAVKHGHQAGQTGFGECNINLVAGIEDDKNVLIAIAGPVKCAAVFLFAMDVDCRCVVMAFRREVACLFATNSEIVRCRGMPARRRNVMAGSVSPRFMGNSIAIRAASGSHSPLGSSEVSTYSLLVETVAPSAGLSSH